MIKEATTSYLDRPWCEGIVWAKLNVWEVKKEIYNVVNKKYIPKVNEKGHLTESMKVEICPWSESRSLDIIFGDEKENLYVEFDNDYVIFSIPWEDKFLKGWKYESSNSFFLLTHILKVFKKFGAVKIREDNKKEEWISL